MPCRTLLSLEQNCCNSSYSFEKIKEIKAEAKILLSVLQDDYVESQKKQPENDSKNLQKVG